MNASQWLLKHEVVLAYGLNSSEACSEAEQVAEQPIPHLGWEHNVEASLIPHSPHDVEYIANMPAEDYKLLAIYNEMDDRLYQVPCCMCPA